MSSVNRNRKTILVEQQATYFNGLSLKEVIVRANELIVIYGEDAVVDMYEPPYDGGSHLYVFMNVSETDAAMAERIKVEEHWEQVNSDNERKQYERLKAQFEGSSK